MSDNVHQLFLANTLAHDNESVAANLHQIADQIAAGEWGDVRNVIGIINAGSVKRCTIGAPIDRAQVVGILNVAIHRMCCDQCED